MFESLDPMPPDAILGLMQLYREDPREEKIDLGVGVYKDARGDTPVLRAVKAAEARLQQREETKAYICLLYTSPSPRDATLSRMPSSA